MPAPSAPPSPVRMAAPPGSRSGKKSRAGSTTSRSIPTSRAGSGPPRPAACLCSLPELRSHRRCQQDLPADRYPPGSASLPLSTEPPHEKVTQGPPLPDSQPAVPGAGGGSSLYGWHVVAGGGAAELLAVGGVGCGDADHDGLWGGQPVGASGHGALRDVCPVHRGVPGDPGLSGVPDPVPGGAVRSPAAAGDPQGAGSSCRGVPAWAAGREPSGGATWGAGAGFGAGAG